ncbi:MAG: serine hydrolase [Chitinophagaceae bacterium]|nr:serine hydrolase [Chitinophagaceae bacterium]
MAAVAALKLVEVGKLPLDADVRVSSPVGLSLPVRILDARPVTLRGLLSHTAGTNVSGMKGYESGSPLPTTTQVLYGLPPANTAAVKTEIMPGTEWRYSGGGYVIAQALMTDVTGRHSRNCWTASFCARRMTGSSFRQPLTRHSMRAAHGRARWLRTSGPMAHLSGNGSRRLLVDDTHRPCTLRNQPCAVFAR